MLCTCHIVIQEGSQRFYQLNITWALGSSPLRIKNILTRIEMVSERLRILGALVAIAVPSIYLLRCKLQRRKLASPERVLILGASSGVGHATAIQYARRGVRVCVVARRADKINALAAKCGDNCIAVAADLSVVDDMVRVRQTVEKAWGGLDTIHVCAGVSALRLILELTGSEGDEDASNEGIQNAQDIAMKAVQGNFTGPLVAALTFVRILSLKAPGMFP